MRAKAQSSFNGKLPIGWTSDKLASHKTVKSRMSVFASERMPQDKDFGGVCSWLWAGVIRPICNPPAPPLKSQIRAEIMFSVWRGSSAAVECYQ